jgi:hypothetical protein
VCFSVWQGLERHPFYRTLHEVIERRVGVSALASIFALGDPTELRTLLTGAGFRRATIEAVSMSSRFPQPSAFLAGEIEVDTAAIPAMQRLTDVQREAIVSAIGDEMRRPLAEATRDDHVVLEFHAHIAVAWK